MKKQLSPRSYRKIWIDHNGPIPRDQDGRSYEIHHIDGDHSNCDISNLKLVTIQEHYDLHYAQGDWGACFMMGERMRLSPEVLSDLSRKTQLERVSNGTHHWQGPENNRKLIETGLHPFLDKDAARDRNLKRVKTGSHNLLKRADGTSQASDMVAVGRHHFVKNNPAKLKSKEGSLPSQIKLSCIHCKRQCSLNNFKKLHEKCQSEILPVND